MVYACRRDLHKLDVLRQWQREVRAVAVVDEEVGIGKLRELMASSLTMELLTLVLALPLLYKLYDGTLWTPFNYSVVIGMAVILLVSL